MEVVEELDGFTATSDQPFINGSSRGADPADIIWVNRGSTTSDTDGFNAVFGANATRARGVMDQVIVDFERIIGSFNYATSSTYNLSASMGTFNGNGASASLTGTLGGKPRSGSVSMGRGGNGLGSGWFLDPTPSENSEFLGSIQNAFSGDVQSGSPATNLGDFYTVAAAEITHVLGLFGNVRTDTAGWASRTRDTGIVDSGEGGNVGTYWVFEGPSISHLMTSNNGGGGGSSFNSAIHSAGHGNGAVRSVSFEGQTWNTVNDIGNAIYEFGRRYVPNLTFALMFRDAYGFTGVDPSSYGTFYANRSSSGVITVRGGSSTSADNIEVTVVGSNLRVSVDVGSDIGGTGALPGPGNLSAWVSEFPIAGITSISIDTGDGADTITLQDLPSTISTTLTGGDGSDTIIVGNDSLDSIQGTVSIVGGNGSDTVLVADIGSSGLQNYVVSSTSVARGGASLIRYSAIEALQLSGNAQAGTFTIISVASTTPVTILGGGGDDNFVINTEVAGGAFSSTLTLIGEAGNDSLFYNDQAASTSGITYRFTSTSIDRTGRSQAQYFGFESLSLAAGTLSNTINVNSTPDGVALALLPSGGLDALAVGSAVGIARVEVPQSTTLGATSVSAGSTLSQLNAVTLTASLLSVGGQINVGSGTLNDTGSLSTATIVGLLSNGYAGGSWSGVGPAITSSTAASTSLIDGLGYSTDANTIRYTLSGDANLNGVVDFNDLIVLAVNYNLPGRGWSQGNFNYDSQGLADFQDLILVAVNYNQSLPAPRIAARSLFNNTSVRTQVLNQSI